jgi:hypothetical protein
MYKNKKTLSRKYCEKHLQLIKLLKNIVIINTDETMEMLENL